MGLFTLPYAEGDANENPPKRGVVHWIWLFLAQKRQRSMDGELYMKNLSYGLKLVLFKNRGLSEYFCKFPE